MHLTGECTHNLNLLLSLLIKVFCLTEAGTPPLSNVRHQNILCYNRPCMAEYIEEMVTPEDAATVATLRKQRWMVAGLSFLGLLVLAGIVFAVVALTKHPAAATNIRDIFIIFMAFESLIIGAALVVLVVQIASLINLLQNEVKPILQSTSETVNTLRGTTEFLSENLVEPVIKLNSYLAGLKKFFDLFGSKK